MAPPWRQKPHRTPEHMRAAPAASSSARQPLGEHHSRARRSSPIAGRAPVVNLRARREQPSTHRADDGSTDTVRHQTLLHSSGADPIPALPADVGRAVSARQYEKIGVKGSRQHPGHVLSADANWSNARAASPAPSTKSCAASTPAREGRPQQAVWQRLRSGIGASRL